jgi:hypothetical protein
MLLFLDVFGGRVRPLACSASTASLCRAWPGRLRVLPCLRSLCALKRPDLLCASPLALRPLPRRTEYEPEVSWSLNLGFPVLWRIMQSSTNLDAMQQLKPKAIVEMRDDASAPTVDFAITNKCLDDPSMPRRPLNQQHVCMGWGTEA